MTFQPCFLAVEKRDRMSSKSIAPSAERKPPEIFCRSFIMRPSRSACAARSLHDPPEAAAKGRAEFGQAKGQAAVRQRPILRAVIAVDAPAIGREVAGRRLCPGRPRRQSGTDQQPADRGFLPHVGSDLPPNRSAFTSRQGDG
jgi:hypothetical protein